MLRSSRIEWWRGIGAPIVVARRGLPITPFPNCDALVEDAVRMIARLVEAKAVDVGTSAALDDYLDRGGVIESYRMRYESLAGRRRAQWRLDAARARAAYSRTRADLLRARADEQRDRVLAMVTDEVIAHAVVGAAPMSDAADSRDRRGT